MRLPAAIALLLLAVFAGCRPSPAPEVEVSLLGGQTLSPGALRGRPVWLEFWAPWDPASRQRILDVPRLLEGGSWEVVVLAVAVGATAEEVRQLVGPGEFPLFYAVAGLREARAFQVEVVPTTVFLDRSGRVVYRREGYVEPQVLRERLRSLVG